MLLRVGHRSDVGRTREENQDSLLVDTPLFLVADGMGGMRGGGTASAIAVEVMASHVPELRDESDPQALIARAVGEAHRRILEEGAANPDLAGMGTTLTGAVALPDGRLLLVHVGDSRCYRLRGGVLELLTEDHSYVQELVRRGEITAEEARIHPQRSLITKALGAGPAEELEPVLTVVDARNGDRFLLCSDGLYGMLDDADIARLLSDETDSQQAADRLVDMANARHSLDNVTVVVIDVVEGGGGTVQVDVPVVTADVQEKAQEKAEPQVEAVSPTVTGDDLVPSKRRRRRRPRGRRWALRILLTLLVLALLAVGVAFGGRTVLLRDWYVACDGAGQVAVFRGVPHQVLGFTVSRFESEPPPPVDCSRLPAETRQRIGDGVAVRDRGDAVATVDNYRCQTLGRPCPPPPGG